MRLGAIPAGADDLGPISPELALVDPDLARRARELLPQPRERTRPRPAPACLPASAEPVVHVRRRRRWAKTLVLAALILVAGAASGTIVAPQHEPPPGATLELRPPAPAAPLRAKQHEQFGAPNVLGVVTRASRRWVSLAWQRSAGSERVVVLRAPSRGPSQAVYRGRGTRYEDRAIRPCTTYRYTLVSYDHRGRRSTGVSSSVVTPGCA